MQFPQGVTAASRRRSCFASTMRRFHEIFDRHPKISSFQSKRPKKAVGILTILLLSLFGTSFPIKSVMSNSSNSASERLYTSLSADCLPNGPGIYNQVSLPMQIIPFTFDPVNGVKRQAFTFALLCKNLSSVTDYMSKVTSPVLSRDGDFDIYNIGISNQLYVRRDRSLYYFCEPHSLRRDAPPNDSFRGCKVEVPLNQSYEFGSGQTLIAGYGIDYQNRRHIADINRIIRSFVHVGLEAR